MNAKPFLDSNILVYVFSKGDPRTAIAENLLFDGGVISVQVLNEFVNVLQHKERRPWAEIRTALTSVRALLDPPVQLTVKLHEKAVTLAERYGSRIYDCLIVAAALEVGCTTLYTEDLQHGQVIDGLTVRNPFIS